MNNQIIWHQTSSEKIACSICESNEPKTFVLQIQNPLSSNYLDLYRCHDCDSCFFHPMESFSYNTEENDCSDIHTKYYVEQGAGIDFFITWLCALRQNKRIRSLLEVGCGFGFSLDFAEKVLNWKAVGFDPSFYSIVGKKMLGVSIYHEYLHKATLEIKQQKFDVVFAVEVIEHVDNPKQFIEIMKNQLTSDGILVFTTPNGDFVNQETAHQTLVGILSPPEHIYIFSEKNITMLLKNAGFTHIKILRQNQSLITFASTKAFLISENAKEKRLAYLEYLQKLYMRIPQDSDLYNGIAYRLFTESLNLGKFQKAELVYKKLEQLLIKKYTDTVINPEKMVKVLATIETFNDISKICPYNIAGFFYFSGILNLVYKKNYQNSAVIFSCCFSIILKLIPLSKYFSFLSDLLWRAKYHEGFSYLLAEKRQEAIQIFLFILNNKEKQEKFCFCAPQPEIVNDALYQYGIAELQQGNLQLAIDKFKQVIEEERSQGQQRLSSSAAWHIGLASSYLIERQANELSSEHRKNFLNGTKRQIGSLKKLSRIRNKLLSYIRFL